MNEKLSALMDSELTQKDQEEELDRVLSDSSLRESWQRYHLASAVLKDQAQNLSSGFADRVAAAVNEEATVVAPGALRQPGRFSSVKVNRYVALAASLAAISILALQFIQPLQDSEEPSAVAEAPPVQWRDMNNTNRLTQYLVEHGEFTRPSGMNGLTAYAKFVANSIAQQKN